MTYCLIKYNVDYNIKRINIDNTLMNFDNYN